MLRRPETLKIKSFVLNKVFKWLIQWFDNEKTMLKVRESLYKERDMYKFRRVDSNVSFFVGNPVVFIKFF